MPSSYSFYLVPGGGVEPPRGCPRRILSPLQAHPPTIALSRDKSQGARMTRLCVFCLDCSEAHDSHRIQAGGATQTATGGDCSGFRPIRFSASFLRVALPKFSTTPCAYLNPNHRLPHRRAVNIRVLRHRKFFLSFCETLVTVLVRSKVTLYVLLGHSISLHRLCVALCAQGALKNENPSGFSCCLRSCSSPVCVYACCHAQRCVRSRTRPGRRSTSMSARLQCPQGTCPVAGKTGQDASKVALSQGTSLRGCLAY
jgi:hypothetical protein